MMKTRLTFAVTFICCACILATLTHGQAPSGAYTSPALGSPNAVVTNATGSSSQTVIMNPSGGGGIIVSQPSFGGASSPFFKALDAGSNTVFAVTNGTGVNHVDLVGTASHPDQGAANSDFAGTLTCATSVATKTFAVAYTSTPVILLFDETTKGGVNLTAKSNSAFSISCTGATDVNDYIVIGNPN